MSAMDGKQCVSVVTMKEWSKRFSEGRVSVKDDDWLGQVDEIETGNQRVTAEGNAKTVNISYGSVHTILHQHLQYQFMCFQTSILRQEAHCMGMTMKKIGFITAKEHTP
jgi:hypothetical protein